MFEKLKNELDVNNIKQEQVFNRDEIENRVIFSNYINNIQDIIIQR